MKKILILPSLVILFWFGAGRISSGADSDYMKYVRTDSAYVYKWNATDAAWVLSQVQFYQYSDGKVSELLTKDLTLGFNVERSVYSYNENGLIQSVSNYYYLDEWKNSTRVLYEYDLLGMTTSVRVQKWSGDVWIEDRLQQNYEYDVEDRLVAYESVYWRNNSWTLPTISDLSYNLLGKLEYHLATRPGGNIDYRIVYEYNDMGFMTQFYTQYPSGGGWSNWNLRTIQYNKCGRKTGQTNYTGEGPDWNPSTRTEWFTSFNKNLYPGKKVPVCHNGHTMWVSPEALESYLRRGDCLGECLDERETPPANGRDPLFTIFPNPATEMITIRFNPDLCCEQMRVELTDYSGKLVKTYPVNDTSDLIIERGKLKSGYYNIRLIIGKETYSQTFIFQ
jgi:hypothetical protein